MLLGEGQILIRRAARAFSAGAGVVPLNRQRVRLLSAR
jgi:hypothetical protein